MKNSMVKSIILGLGITFLFSATVFAGMEDKGMEDKGIEKEVDGIKVNLSFMTKDAKTGSNDLMIKLYDSNDRPIGGATVKVSADMDRTKDDMDSQMKDSPPLQIEPKSSHEEVGQYMSEINFTDEGKWMIKVNFNIDGKDSVADFELNVVKSGPNWYIIGGFLGVVAIVIVFAAINKKRKPVRT